MPFALGLRELAGVLKSTVNAIDSAAETEFRRGPPLVKVKDVSQIQAAKTALAAAIAQLDLPGSPPIVNN